MKYKAINILSIITMLLAGIIAYYFLARSIILQQLDKDLQLEEQEILSYIKENNSLPNIPAYKDVEIKFEAAGDKAITRKVISIKDESKAYPVRQLTFSVTVKGRLHKATVTKSYARVKDLLRSIFRLAAGTSFILLIFAAVINYWLLNRLWRPFYTTMRLSLKEFNSTTANEVYLPKSDIKEFRELNRSFEEMAARVSREYESLKTFADHAWHEMQTPLAIIYSRLGSLIQSSDENQAGKLRVIYDVTGRLIKHNERLRLLAKINGGQYNEVELINFRLLVKDKLEQFDTSIKNKEIRLTSNLADVSVLMNKELADILLDNLLSNAIKHNITGGSIICELTKWKLAVSNTGPALNFDKADLFKRFPESQHSDGMGLGLVVVKRICDNSGLTISYAYSDGVHTFSILF